MIKKRRLWADKVLQGSDQTLQLAGLYQISAKYQSVSKLIPDLAICPPGNELTLVAGLLRLVAEHGIQISGEPVLIQLVRLITRVDVWADEYKEHRQPIRLLALWLDKLLRQDLYMGNRDPNQMDWLRLSPLEKRCLGRLEDPWWGWCSGQIPSCPTSTDGFSKALDIALQARLIQSGSFMSRLKWLKNQQTPLDLTILIYGALANGSPL